MNSAADRIREAIERRAYELFERRGCRHGKDWQDWFQAEQQILSDFKADTVTPIGATGLIEAADWTLGRLA